MRTNMTGRSGHRRQAQSGFTLLEMILVISTILFLLGFLIAMASTASMDAQQHATRSFIEALETALQNFYTLHGEYPPVGGNNTENRANLYEYLTSEKYGKCLDTWPESLVAYEPYGDNVGRPYFVDSWGSQIYFVAFNAEGLKPNPSSAGKEYQYMWAANGNVPLVWSIGPDKKGWDAMTVARGKSSKGFVNLMYEDTKPGDEEDNISNFRDIPLEYIK